MADSAQPSGIFYPNDYTLSELTLLTSVGSLDMRIALIEMAYTEDVFNNTASGYIMMVDSQGWIEKWQLSGNEFLRIKLGKTDDTTNVLKKVFRVFKVTKRTPENDGQTETYMLYFCSEELLLSEQYKVNKSYPNWLINYIIGDILTNKNFGLNVDKSSIGELEGTLGTYNFIVPNLKPFDAINWLSSYAIPNNGFAGADMLFYENKFGYNFKSLNTLYKNAPYQTYSYSAKNTDTSKTTMNDKLKNLLSYEIVDSYDKLDSIHKGMFSNNLLSVDIMTRQFKNTSFNYDNYLSGATVQGKSGNQLNTYKITNNFVNRNNDAVNNIPDSVYRMVFSNFGVDEYNIPRSQTESRITANGGYKPAAAADAAAIKRKSALGSDLNHLDFLLSSVDKKTKKSTLSPNINAEIYIPNRKSQIQLLNHTRVIVSIPGDTGITVGYTVDLQILSKHPVADEKGLDPYYSGKYLVTALKHIVQKKSFVTVLELCKESTYKPYAAVNTSVPNWTDSIKGII